MLKNSLFKQIIFTQNKYGLKQGIPQYSNSYIHYNLKNGLYTQDNIGFNTKQLKRFG